MDKQTLSGYGWIVIVTLVLAVLLALATPFGTYVGDGVVTTVNGLINTSSKAVDEDQIDTMSDKWENKFSTFDKAGSVNGDNGLKLTYVSLGNWEHKLSDGTVESHDTEHGACSKCGENVLVPGLYDENNVMTMSWEELINIGYGAVTVNNGELNVCWPIITGETGITKGKFVLDNTVTSIGDNCFADSSDFLIGIELSNSVTSIGEYAFSCCYNLTITIPRSVKSIGEGAFQSCNLTSIYIPKSVNTILCDSPYEAPFFANENLKIYCESNEKQTNWSEYWDCCGTPMELDARASVEWGVTLDQYKQLTDN